MRKLLQDLQMSWKWITFNLDFALVWVRDLTAVLIPFLVMKLLLKSMFGGAVAQPPLSGIELAFLLIASRIGVEFFLRARWHIIVEGKRLGFTEQNEPKVTPDRFQSLQNSVLWTAQIFSDDMEQPVYQPVGRRSQDIPMAALYWLVKDSVLTVISLPIGLFVLLL